MTCKVQVICTIFLSATKLSFLFNSENVIYSVSTIRLEFEISETAMLSLLLGDLSIGCFA